MEKLSAASSFENLERSLKRIGIILVDDHDYLRQGRPAQCIDLLRKLLLFSSSVVAKQLLLRGCPSHAPEKRVVTCAFDLVREKVKHFPAISTEQFCREVSG